MFTGTGLGRNDWAFELKIESKPPFLRAGVTLLFSASVPHATFVWTELVSQFPNILCVYIRIYWCVCVCVFMPEYAVPPQCIKVTRLCWLWPSVLPGHRLQGLSADKTMSAGHKTERNVTSSSERADSGDRVSSSSGADIEEDSLLFLYVARLDVWVSV